MCSAHKRQLELLLRIADSLFEMEAWTQTQYLIRHDLTSGFDF